MVNYVRFQRGTQAAYDLLVTKDRIDPNTLYFIYADEEATTGTLYMGTKVIGGGTVSVPSISLEQLTDVIATGAETNSFLIKDSSGKWVTRTPAEVASLIQENINFPTIPTTKIYQVTLNENEIYEDAINRIVGESVLNAGDLTIIKELIINNNYKNVPYIYTGETWVTINDKYDVNDIYLDSNLVITLENGTELKHLDTIGKNIKDVLNILYKEINNSQLIGDNSSIEVIDGLIKVKNFGVGYYKYIPAANETEHSTYQYTLGFKENLEPKVILNDQNKLEIAWYEPSTEDIDSINSKISDLTTNIQSIKEEIGVPAQGENIATGLYNKLNEKANKSDVYNKTEVDLAISTAVSNADHLKRKIVNSIDEIDRNAVDALQYIYMVPAGLSFTDDKYDEYIVIEYKENEGSETTRFLEKVGSWEVDLSGYAEKSTTLAGYGITDAYTKSEITELISDITGGESAADVLAQLNEYKSTTDNTLQSIQNTLGTLQPNYISSVDENNFKVTDGKLQLISINPSQVTGLQTILDTGTSLVTESEKATLQAIANGDYDNFIQSVTTDFKVTEEGQLQLIKVSGSALQHIVGDMTTLVDYTEGTTLVGEINDLKQLLTWQEIKTNET